MRSGSVPVTSIRGAASAGYVAVGEVAPAVAGLGCRAKVAVVCAQGEAARAGLQVRPALCERSVIRPDGRFHGQRRLGGQQLEPSAGSNTKDAP